MAEKMLLIDGNSIAFRAFFAMHNQIDKFTNQNGLHTAAIYGFKLMLDHVLALLPEPGDQEGWRPQVRARILACRSLLGRHPWMREAIETRTLATPQALGHMDALMAAMFDGGLSADLVHDAMHTLSTRMWGFTREAMPTPRVPDDPGEREQAIAEFTAMPVSAITPYKVYKDSGLPDTSSPSTTPVNASGTVSRMITPGKVTTHQAL